MKRKDWDKDLMVSFACTCYQKVEVILDNGQTKEVSCKDCGEVFVVTALKVLGGEKDVPSNELPVRKGNKSTSRKRNGKDNPLS